jgi:hypothetical protein
MMRILADPDPQHWFLQTVGQFVVISKSEIQFCNASFIGFILEIILEFSAVKCFSSSGSNEKERKI